LLIAACAIGAAALLLPSTALAQRARARTAPRVIVGTRVFVGAPFYDPWYPFGYWYPAPYYYGPYYYDNSASLQLQVTPKETEVFIDGHYAGVVDSFDGTFQRLHVEPGEHELQLFLPGHRLVTRQIYAQPRNTFRLKYTMEPLGPGEAEPVRPLAAAPSQPRTPRNVQDGRRDDVPRATVTREGAAGSVAIRVQPADAEILIDGERWTGSGDERLVVQLSPGRHHIEVRKDGYRPFATDIDIRSGESAPLNISLGRP
jgi:hypothetical protein